MGSLKDARFHSELKDFVAFLKHLVLQSLVIHWQLSVLEDEALHDVAIVDVYREDLGEADEDVVLHAVLRVDEGRQLLCEVDRLVDGHLRSLFLVFLEQERQRLNYEVPGRVVVVQSRAVFQHRVILRQLRKEVV